MGIVVTKFGGSSLADAGQFRKVRDILLADENRKYVVPSAPAAATRTTPRSRTCSTPATPWRLRGARTSLRRHSPPSASGTWASWRSWAFPRSASPRSWNRRALRSFPAWARDYAASRGEFLNGLLLSAYLGWEFIDAAEVIFFDAAGPV